MNKISLEQVQLELEPDEDAAEYQKVCDLLREENWKANPKLMEMLTDASSKQPLNLIAKIGDQVIGGLLAYNQAKWMRIEVMAVDRTYRRCGIGSSLLQQAERIAQSRGCIYSYVDTLEHQAPRFYASRGYQTIGEIPDWDSHGNSKYFLTRALGMDD